MKGPLTDKQITGIIREVRSDRRRKFGTPAGWVVVSTRSKFPLSNPPIVQSQGGKSSMKDATKRAIAEIQLLAKRARNNPRARGNLSRDLREQYLKLVDDAFAIIRAHGGESAFQVGPYTYCRHSPQHALEAWTNGYPVMPWSSIETELQFEEMVRELKVGIQKKLRSLRRRAS